jgi:MarR family 2-MHQ and catechol resistance regulon transcriptional repressor
MPLTAAPARITVEEALDRFWETVPPLWGQIRSHVRAVAREEFRLGVEQFQVLRLIRQGKDSVSEIAAARNISRPAVSQAVDVLYGRGLLTRTQDLQDRRHTRLTLTKQGSAVLDAVFGDTRLWMRRRMADFTPAELERIVAAMDSLRKILE